MTRNQGLKLIREARKEFAGQHWGHDDDAAVDAFVKILKKHLPPKAYKGQTNDESPEAAMLPDDQS